MNTVHFDPMLLLDTLATPPLVAIIVLAAIWIRDCAAGRMGS